MRFASSWGLNNVAAATHASAKSRHSRSVVAAPTVAKAQTMFASSWGLKSSARRAASRPMASKSWGASTLTLA
jgi:hypothetical protein